MKDTAKAGTRQPPACNTGVKSATRGSKGGLYDGSGGGFVAVGDAAPELFHYGLDWCRGTTGRDDTAAGLAIGALALAKELEGEGFAFGPAKRLGYDGFRAGPIFFGTREDGAMIDASSIAADAAFELVRHAEARVTRLDLQVTVQFPHDDPVRARRMCESAARLRAMREKFGRPWKLRLTDGVGDGDTLVIGSRSSEAYGRSYDKYREAYSTPEGKQLYKGQFEPGCWRYEVEFKGSKARQVAEMVGSSRGVVMEHVKSWYEEHGVEVPVQANAVPVVRELRRVTDVERQLAWLAKQVAPTVADLIARGYRNEVYQALKLPPPALPL